MWHRMTTALLRPIRAIARGVLRILDAVAEVVTDAW